MAKEVYRKLRQTTGLAFFALCAYAAQDANPVYQLHYNSTQPSTGIIVERPQFDPSLNAADVFADWTKSHQQRRQTAELTAQR